MAKTILSNPAYEITSKSEVYFDLKTPVSELVKNPNIIVTYKLPFRTPCPCCGAKMKKIDRKKWQCPNQENVFIEIK